MLTFKLEKHRDSLNDLNFIKPTSYNDTVKVLSKLATAKNEYGSGIICKPLEGISLINSVNKSYSIKKAVTDVVVFYENEEIYGWLPLNIVILLNKFISEVENYDFSYGYIIRTTTPYLSNELQISEKNINEYEIWFKY